jgi:hypothetical protein
MAALISSAQGAIWRLGKCPKKRRPAFFGFVTLKLIEFERFAPDHISDREALWLRGPHPVLYHICS